MYSPPEGYTDLLADADRRPPAGALRPAEVPGVGMVTLMPPSVAGTAYLAASVHHKFDARDQMDHLTRFVQLHTGEGEYDRLMWEMVTDAAPADVVQRVARAIATTDTARPYLAVSSLAGVTGRHWFAIRARIIGYGIADPMGLPSMHTLLDVTEAMIVESINAGDPKKAKRELTSFYDKLYAPERTDTRSINGSGYKPKPAGFDDDDTFDSFAGFAKAVR